MTKYPRFTSRGPEYRGRRHPGPFFPQLALGIAMLFLIAGCGDSGSGGDASVTRESDQGSPVFATADGSSAAWEDYRGGWVLVNYWAEWCKPCLEEIPELNDVNGIDGVTVMAVNFDGITGEELVELGARMDIQFTMLTDDPAPILGWTMPGALPVTFVVNPDGELTETLLGPQTEEGLLALMGLENH